MHNRRFLVSSWPVLFCVLLTILNDHYLKYSSLSGFVTGKISDFAGLFFFPFLLKDISNCFPFPPRHRNHRKIFLCILIITAVLFSLLKTAAEFRELFSSLYQNLFHTHVQVVPDLSDLAALIALYGSFLYYNRIREAYE